MVLFSTTFAISEDLTRSHFLDMVRDWLLNDEKSKLCLDDMVWSEEIGEYHANIENDEEQFVAYQTEQRFGIQWKQSLEDVIITRTYVMSEIDNVPVMFVRVEQTNKRATLNNAISFQIPHLMQKLFWEEFGGMDHGLATEDMACVLRKRDHELATNILSQSVEFFHPVVYVSADDDGTYGLSYDELAKELLGMAHVVVAGSPNVTHALVEEGEKSKGRGKNKTTKFPCTCDKGDMLVLLPSGEYQLFKKEQLDVKEIAEFVHKTLINVSIPEACSFQNLRLSFLASKGDGDLGQIFEELLSEKDSEIAALKAQLEQKDAELRDTKYKADALSHSLGQKHESDADSAIVLGCKETPFYDGELSDVVLRVLKKEYDAMCGDNKLEKCRKCDVLKSILEVNEISQKAEDVKNVFRENVKTGTMNKENIKEVERCGFSVVLSGNNHYKIAFCNDPRYAISMSSTPSDNRAGDNLTSTYMNMLFGY